VAGEGRLETKTPGGRQRVRLRIRGIVQGVGFRPFVYRIAQAHHISGWVLNDTLGVLVEAEGTRSDVPDFAAALKEEAPPLSVIEGIEAQPLRPKGEKSFRILKSASCKGKELVLPPDIATCGDCLREVLNPADRRFRYAFTNCTNCGPRYTIVKDTPYDRPRTSMSKFRMCALCRREYETPQDRRFHAQPNACAVCGPRLTLTDARRRTVRSSDPLGKTAELLRAGLVVAIKGLGGFHLACDATNDSAVRRLRKRKRRPYKPFAVMSQDVATVRTYAHVSNLEKGILESWECPIVLLRKKRSGRVSGLVAPNISDIGVMLPYTPLHHVLVREGFLALVMTSGNLTDEPTIASNDAAYEKLSGIADYFLVHNREILIQNDDSIVKVIGKEPVLMRRARGYVPRPLPLPGAARDIPDILAVGAEEKGTVCFVKDGRAYLSQHLGDLKNSESVASFENTVAHTERLLKVRPGVVVHDLHPSYSSTKYALRRRGARKMAVQHHYTHIAACLAENGVTGKVIGISCDGVGLGEDGKTWGGELLVADLSGFRRVGHLEYVHLPGGDAAAKEPYRMAVSYLWHAFGKDSLSVARRLIRDAGREKVAMVLGMIEKDVQSPLTSSTGRLFDAVASLAGVCHLNTYEGQAPMELESLAWAARRRGGSYPYRIRDENGVLVVDLKCMIVSLSEEMRKGEAKERVAAKFHNTVARYLRDICRKIREREGLGKAALSGGVFQNRFLTERLVALLEKDGFEVFTHRAVPPNDGCISYGQAAWAAYTLTQQEGRNVSCSSR
jgi:hydrogenase maturation protein HypF